MTRRDRLAARLVRLYLGLGGFGVSLALMVRARLGLGRWDVLHQGIARHLGMQLGWTTIAVGGLVLLAWIPLRQRPGPGTVRNAITVGPVVNSALDVPPAPGSLAWRGVACWRDRAERAGHRLLRRRRPWPRPARRADDRHGRAVTCCARSAR